MKDVGRDAETTSLGRKDGQKYGQMDGIMHTRTDKGHFYSPSPPTSDDKTTCTSSYHRKKVYKFQVNPMKDVGGVAETSSWLAKFKSAWTITLSKKSNKNSNTKCTSSYHRKKVYKI